MSATNPVFIYIGTYGSEAAARADFAVVQNLYVAEEIGTYDAAVITKGGDGTVHVSKEEMATRHGLWNGAAAGALVGLLFPPSILVGAVVGAGAGALGGHLWKGLSRSDVKELGDLIDAGEAALLIVGESKVQGAFDKAELTADKHVAKVLELSADEIDNAIGEAAVDVT